MAKKSEEEIIKINKSLTILCNETSNNVFESKMGNDYISALSQLYQLDNRNDIPFTREDIVKQPLLKDFQFEGVEDYEFVCKLKAEPMIIDFNNITGKTKGRKNEKIIAYDFINENKEEIFNNHKGVSYIITSNVDDKEYIIKIGQTRKTFRERLGSYNCGVVFNWRTASTTNIKLVQSFVTTRLEFNLYLYDCSDDEYILEWHNVKSVPFASPKSLAVEDIMVKKFQEQFHTKPLCNIQTDAEE